MKIYHSWTSDDIRFAQAMRRDGCNFDQIGAKMGRSRHSVRRALAKAAPGVTKERESSVTRHRINAKVGSDNLKVAALKAIVRYANDNRIDIDTAASRLLSGAA